MIYDTIYVSKNQLDRAMKKAIPVVGALFGMRVCTSKFMPDNKILLVNNGKVVGIVNFEKRIE